MNQIIICRLKDCFCSVTALHKATGIPMATVSRCVASLRSKGWLVEQAHPEDGRRRMISIDSGFLKIAGREIDKMATWFNHYRENGSLSEYA